MSPTPPIGPAMFGREAEQAQICALLDRSGEALVLTGPPGIGRSALLSSAGDDAVRRGRRVLQVTGAPAESDVPYAGLERLLRPVVPASPHHRIDRVLLGDDKGETPRPHRVALAALDRLGDGPTLLLADDAQWLDEETWQTLAYVGRRLGGAALVLLMAMCDGPATIRRLTGSGLPELAIGPVAAEAAVRIVDAVAPSLPTVLRNRVLAEAAGHPLGLRELASTAAGGDAGVLTGLPLSGRLAAAVLAPVAELPEGTRHLLVVAALHDADDAEEILRAAGAGVRELTPAVDARLVEVGDGTLRLRHPLLAAALARSTAPDERRAAHTALAGVVADADRRTWHRTAAVTGADDAVAEALHDVARRAELRGAGRVAVATWERAAQLSADPRRRAYRYLRAADCADDLGETAAADRLTRLVDDSRLSDRERLWLCGRSDGLGGDVDIANARLLAHVEAADQWLDSGHPDDAFDILGMVTVQLWFTPLAPEVRAAVVAFVRRTGLGTDDARATALLALAAPLEHGRAVVAALPRYVSTPRADPAQQIALAWAAVAVGALGPAKTLVVEAVDRCRAQHRVGRLTRALATAAWVGVFSADAHLIDGSAPEAVRLAEETDQPMWGMVAALACGMAAALRGEQGVAERSADDAVKAFLPHGAYGTICLVQFVRGTGALAVGNAAAAFDHLRRIFDAGDVAFHPTVRFWAVGSLAEAAVLGERTDELRELMIELDAEEAASGSPALSRGLTLARTMLTLLRSPAGHAPEDVATELARHPFDKARADHAHGASLRRDRQHGRARPYLRAAASLFDALGADAWAARSRQELRATGESVRPPEAVRDVLTAQEARIAELAAQGLTNKEIGQKLFLSARTVGSHLYRIFPKLGVTARSELAAALGPVPPP